MQRTSQHAPPIDELDEPDESALNSKVYRTPRHKIIHNLHQHLDSGLQLVGRCVD